MRQNPLGNVSSRLLRHDSDAGDVILQILYHDGSLDLIADVQFAKVGIGLDGVFHRHGFHPIADLAGLDGRALGGRVKVSDFALHGVLFCLLL